MTDEVGYKYDIFISYRNKSGVQDWVLKRFVPLLKRKLEVLMPIGWYDNNQCIFVDKEGTQEGQYWKIKIPKELKRSRIMIAVLIPDYFNSDWCMSEWKSFAKREEVFREELSLEDEQSLIFTVTYGDGKHFPEFAKEMQSHQDYSMYTSMLPAFDYSSGALDFENKVQRYAETLAEILENIVVWDTDFPIEEAFNLPPTKITDNPIF